MWVKICGLRTPEAVDAVSEGGADAAGFIMVPDSRRYVEPSLARSLAARLPEGTWKVGVFRGQSEHEITQAMEAGGLDTVQLHDYGDLDMCRRLQAAGLRVIRAFGLRPGMEPGVVFSTVEPFVAAGVTLLLDAWQPGGGGGLGVAADWEQAATVVREFPNAHIILAGGLNPGNLVEAIKTVRPWGVDVSSGVERQGQKDPELIRSFIKMCKTETGGECGWRM